MCMPSLSRRGGGGIKEAYEIRLHGSWCSLFGKQPRGKWEKRGVNQWKGRGAIQQSIHETKSSEKFHLSREHWERVSGEGKIEVYCMRERNRRSRDDTMVKKALKRRQKSKMTNQVKMKTMEALKENLPHNTPHNRGWDKITGKSLFLGFSCFFEILYLSIKNSKRKGRLFP